MSNSNITSGQKAVFTFRVAHFSNVQVQILDSFGRIAAVFDEGAVFPNRDITVTWDGKVTDGNGLSLSSGDAAPAGTYTINITAGSTSYTASGNITVS
jgi:flagellar hook assembly protein FlgD